MRIPISLSTLLRKHRVLSHTMGMKIFFYIKSTEGVRNPC